MTESGASHVDVFVIGGGINGCGIARDAVGRGYSVMLAEKDDLAQGTSSGSTKLVHGGLRYLEHFEFRLVREALTERETLWAMAPHIIWPLRFVLPHHRGLRPAWLLRLGLFLYDHLGGRKLLPPARTLDLRRDLAGGPLRARFEKGFEYSDCWVNDARLVVLNARDAADRGADIRVRTRVISARWSDEGWTVEIEDTITGTRETVTAALLVNAAGPWIDEVLSGVVGHNEARNVRLVQGSHIVVRKLFEHDRCYIFQNADDRIIFAIPYEGDYTLIGTTDRDWNDGPDDVKISAEEIRYLVEAASEYFERPVSGDDVVWTYSAVRPLYDDGASKAQEATRDYVLKTERENGAPLINIFGGKITTYRRLSEEVLEKIDGLLNRSTRSWTAGASLTGGDFPATGFADLLADLSGAFPFLGKRTLHRFARLYGTEAKRILAGASRIDDLGHWFGADLYEREVRHLMEREWAMRADDILWRRTKVGLQLDATQQAALAHWLREHGHGQRRNG
ncbi:glycerol-3-phosphate dehydrogenase [Minwuia sp.]|uniref:glycerol-3-phosphate dehydrogenase n=1 Tax=Minwuia sp. TaxID=2493630 RepID=UPI003A8E3AED